MIERKTFGAVETMDDLTRVNDAQQARCREIAAASDGTWGESRQQAYLTRWREALAYIPQGAALLDIGNGWPVPNVWDAVVRDWSVEYFAVDIQPDQIEATRSYLVRYGLPAENAKVGSNTGLDFPSNRFDFVFSSHCIEHSPSLETTFHEVRRVLRPGGTIFFAVPFGFDDSDEHLFYFDVEDWLRLVELAGFEIVNYQVSRTYTLFDWDLVVVARSAAGEPDWASLRAMCTRLSKAGKSVAYSSDPIFSYGPGSSQNERFRILAGVGTQAILSSQRPIDAVLTHRHPWSGIVEFSDGVRRRAYDLNSRLNYIQALDVRELRAPIRITVTGGEPSRQEAVIFGALLSAQAAP